MRVNTVDAAVRWAFDHPGTIIQIEPGMVSVIYRPPGLHRSRAAQVRVVHGGDHTGMTAENMSFALIKAIQEVSA